MHLTFPERTASSNASGIDAAEVFPYSSRLVMTYPNIVHSDVSSGDQATTGDNVTYSLHKHGTEASKQAQPECTTQATQATQVRQVRHASIQQKPKAGLVYPVTRIAQKANRRGAQTQL